MKNNKPLHFLIFKIVGILGIAVLIYGIILAVKGFGDFESNNFMIGSLLTPIGLFAGVSGFAIGFKPEITKMTVKSAKYIQNENQNDLKEIVNTTADIAKDAVTTTTKAVAHGITNEETMFCKHCGAKIDVDSKFCKSCGKEL